MNNSKRKIGTEVHKKFRLKLEEDPHLDQRGEDTKKMGIWT